jgi:hypothetical protein
MRTIDVIFFHGCFLSLNAWNVTGSLPPDSKFVSIVCRARMVSTGGNEIYTGSCYSGQIAAAEGADQCLLCSAFQVGKGIWGRLIYYLIENSYMAFIFIGQSLPPFSGL